MSEDVDAAANAARVPGQDSVPAGPVPPSTPYSPPAVSPPVRPDYRYPQQPPHPLGRPGGSGRSTVSGWVWPVVAGLALVTGLFAGALSAVVVSTSMNSGGPVLGTDAVVASPTAQPEKGSVSAVAAQLLPSTVQIVARPGGSGGGATGSGFVVDRRGHVITNNHVVAGAAEGGTAIQVVDKSGVKHDAKIVGRSPVYDIAVLLVQDTDKLRPAALGSSQSMQVGETVVAIGSPLGLNSTVTSGIISALDRPVTTGEPEDASFINAVQTDAAINPGNSGGPLVNLRGQVVGVNSAIATTGGLGGSGNIGVGFAIPMEQVQTTAAQIIDTGEARYPVIGAEIDPDADGPGATLGPLTEGAPAEDSGLRAGDVVVAVDEVPIDDGVALIVAIRTHQPGEVVDMQVERDGRTLTVQVELDSKVG